MMCKKVYSLLVFVVVFFVTSCKSSDYVRVYQYQVNLDLCIDNKNEEIKFNRIAIVLRNDSIMEYQKLYGGLGSITTSKYMLSKCKLIVDSLDIYGHINPEISNMSFLYNQDSLVNIKTNSKYYSEKYLNKTRIKTIK